MNKIFFAFLLFSLTLNAPTYAADEVLATINNEPITDSQILPKVKNSMMKILAQQYEIKRDAVDEEIADRLLNKAAKAQNISVDALIKKEVESKITPPSEEEAKGMYEVYKKKFNDKPYEEVSQIVKNQLLSQKKQKAMSEYLAGLRKAAKIEYKIERPAVNVSVDDDPGIGNPNAPIKVIEFSDYQCPFCKRARPTVDKITSTYKDTVYYVFRDFPLSFHKQAKGASNAANCAGEQKKYFEYAHKLWENQGQHTDDKLKSIAKELGLDSAKFDACLSSNKYFKEIDKDQAEGAAAGVSGTPAYFINGKFLSGAQPFESFQEIIEEELAKLKK